MKHCPSCHAVYRAEIEFCFREGTELVPGVAPVALPEPTGRLDSYAPSGLLAEGDSGVVHLGRLLSSDLGTELAIKVLDPRATADHRARFVAAYEHGREITHDGLTRVLDFGQQDGVAFATMPRLQGRTLAAILAQMSEGHTVPPWQALAIAADLAEALVPLHTDGAHGNIHPHQVMLTERGELVLLGFGDVFPLDPCAVLGPLHRFAFAAPEVLRGQPTSTASDLHSLGVIAATLLAGKNELQQKDVSQTVLAVLTDSVEIPRKGIPSAARKMLVACLNERPKRRPASASEFAGAMRDALIRLNGPPITTARQAWLVQLFGDPNATPTVVQVDVSEG